MLSARSGGLNFLARASQGEHALPSQTTASLIRIASVNPFLSLDGYHNPAIAHHQRAASIPQPPYPPPNFTLMQDNHEGLGAMPPQHGLGADISRPRPLPKRIGPLTRKPAAPHRSAVRPGGAGPGRDPQIERPAARIGADAQPARGRDARLCQARGAVRAGGRDGPAAGRDQAGRRVKSLTSMWIRCSGKPTSTWARDNAHKPAACPPGPRLSFWKSDGVRCGSRRSGRYRFTTPTVPAMPPGAVPRGRAARLWAATWLAGPPVGDRRLPATLSPPPTVPGAA